MVVEINDEPVKIEERKRHASPAWLNLSKALSQHVAMSAVAVLGGGPIQGCDWWNGSHPESSARRKGQRTLSRSKVVEE